MNKKTSVMAKLPVVLHKLFGDLISVDTLTYKPEKGRCISAVVMAVSSRMDYYSVPDSDVLLWLKKSKHEFEIQAVSFDQKDLQNLSIVSQAQFRDVRSHVSYCLSIFSIWCANHSINRVIVELSGELRFEKNKDRVKVKKSINHLIAK